MLSHQQNEALKKIIEFLDDDRQKIFILKGYAGTGKTTLIKFIADYLTENEKSFLLTAPTGRAARILSNKTQLEARTIHSTIYSPDISFVSDDYENESESLNFPLKHDDEIINTLMIIDEASMVSDAVDDDSYLQFGSGSLLEDIFSFLKLNQVSSNKILFVGDPAQLPPVKDDFSPALSADYIWEKYGYVCKEFILTEIIRQEKESNILTNSIQIRQSIEQNLFNNFDIPEADDIKQSHVFDELRFSKINEDRIIISFTNKKALYYNNRYRKEILNLDSDRIYVNDRLLVIQNNRKYKLFNGDFVNVAELQSDSIKEFFVTIRGREEFKFSFIDAKINYLNELNQLVEIEAKLILNHLFSEERGLSIKEQFALRILAEREENFYHPKKYLRRKNPKLYREELNNYIEMLSKSKFFNAVQVKFGYAVTCHKAQGGEWKDVIIDFNDFKNYTNIFFFRWAYTAITRASEKIFLLNPPIISPFGVTKNSEFSQLEEQIEVSKTPLQIEIPENLITEQSKAIYKAVSENHLLAIENINPQNYRDRYSFLYNDEILKVDFIYNKKGNVSFSFAGNQNNINEEFTAELNKIISKVSIIEEEKTDNIAFLILQAIEQKLRGNNILINSAKVKPNYFIIDCSKESEKCTLKIYYNKKYIVTNADYDLTKSTSKRFAEFCKSLIKIGN